MVSFLELSYVALIFFATTRLPGAAFEYTSENGDGIDYTEEFLWKKFMGAQPHDWMVGPRDGALENVIDYYWPTKSDSESCQDAIEKVQNATRRDTRIEFMDSWGKWPDGYMWGNTQPFGMYDQCLNISDSHLDVIGRYCYIKIYPMGTNAKNLPSPLSPTPDERIGFVFGSGELDYLYSYGSCIPDACTEQDLETSLEKTYLLEGQLIEADVICYETLDKREDFTAADISFMAVMSAVCLILFCASAYDYFTEKADKRHLREGAGRYFLTFSLHANLRKLFFVTNKHRPYTITCIHGLRVITMLWIIYEHTYLYGTIFMANANSNDIKYKTENFIFQAISNGSLSVDTFFFLSGLFVVYVSFRHMRRNHGWLDVPLYYLHRYIRLTPALAFICWFQATLWRYLFEGPLAYESYYMVDVCQKNWWANILYVNNYVTDNTDRSNYDCVPQAWFLATDFQIFIVMPLIFVPLFHYKRFGKALLCCAILASGLVPAIITVVLDLPPFNYLLNTPEVAREYWLYIYAAPFSRAGPYLIGMLTGYIIDLNNAAGTKIKMKYWQVALGWLLATALEVTILFGMWPFNVLTDPTTWTGAVQFFYGGFARLLWGIPLGWLVIACHYGYGGPVDWILSHPGFQPFSRLTYTMYLAVVSFQMVFIVSQKQPYYFTHINKLVEACGAAFIAVIMAVIIHQLVEAPIQNLERLIFKIPRGHDQTDSIEESTKKIQLLEQAYKKEKSSKPKARSSKSLEEAIEETEKPRTKDLESTDLSEEAKPRDHGILDNKEAKIEIDDDDDNDIELQADAGLETVESKSRDDHSVNIRSGASPESGSLGEDGKSPIQSLDDD